MRWMLAVCLASPAAAHSLGCGNARALIAGSLPRMITVKVDSALDEEASVALDFWARRLNVSFTRTEKLSECMIYIHTAIPGTVPSIMQSRISLFTIAVSFLPGARQYNGVAYIFTARANVIAHEMGHLFGCVHSPHGLMEADGPPEWTVTTDELSIAHANRVKAVLQSAADNHRE